MEQEIHEIYLGPRDKSFESLIRSVIKKGNLKPKYIDMLTDEKSMDAYATAFSAASADPDKNYEVFEQLGDLSGNKFIVSYAYRRFPQLNCALGVQVVARLRIVYGSKAIFFKIAEDLGFWPYISAVETKHEKAGKKVKCRTKDKKDLLEDVFEAFLGATEFLIDTRIRQGAGYAIVYDILKGIFDDLDISLEYSALVDAKTRIKELFDTFKKNPRLQHLGSLKYMNDRDEMLVTSTVYRVDEKGRRTKLGEGVAALQSDAEQRAAEQGLITMKREGYEKEVPQAYQQFCEN